METEVDTTDNSPMLFIDTRLAVRGNRSKPPCIAFLALIKASFSMCSVQETRIRTINASSHACKYDAPITAKDVNTWKPNCRFCTEAQALANILMPPKETPAMPIVPRTQGFSVIKFSVIITNISITNAMPEAIILHCPEVIFVLLAEINL